MNKINKISLKFITMYTMWSAYYLKTQWQHYSLYIL